MARSRLLALVLGVFVAAPLQVVAIGAGDADAMFDSFNGAFLVQSGTSAFYKAALNNGNPDGSWTGSLDILGAEDVYERTGDPNTKTLIDNLLTTWLKNNAPPWSWDGWNDDIGWFTLALIRGYQMTGNANFLNQAVYGFNYAFGRGWDTVYNGGGIWEENPEYAAKDNPPNTPAKLALSNDSLGKVACLLYQSTHDTNYLNKCRQIYDWVRLNLYNPTTGQINTGIDRQNKVDTSAAAYNQGTFLDFANLVYELTLDSDIYQDAKKALDYGRNHLTVNGIFSNGASYLNTWADEMARGAGHFIRNHKLWGDYYAWMVQNADAIVANRRTDLGITWNAWDQPTSTANTLVPTKFVSALAWLQFTPATMPSTIGGYHVITNVKTGLAIDSSYTYGDGTPVLQWGVNGGVNQKWLITPNKDNSWNIVSMSTWQSIDVPGYATDDGLAMNQWRPNRGANQRWVINLQPSGAYQIKNQATGKSLDGASNSTNGAPLLQWGWNGQSQQLWNIL